MQKILELIELALSQIESDTTRALLRGLIHMLVEQATGSPKVASVDAVIQENANMRSQLEEFSDQAKRMLARQTQLHQENEVFKKALDSKDSSITDLELQVVELRNAHASLLEKEAKLRKELREERNPPCSSATLRHELALWCLKLHYRDDSAGVRNWNPEYWDSQARMVEGKEPLDGRACDAACSVAPLFDRLCREAGI